jgi:hypothetical protein
MNGSMNDVSSRPANVDWELHVRRIIAREEEGGRRKDEGGRRKEESEI